MPANKGQTLLFIRRSGGLSGGYTTVPEEARRVDSWPEPG